MDVDGVRGLVLGSLMGGAALWLVSSWWYRVQGDWLRVLSPDEVSEGAAHERIHLDQWGPWVTGRCEDGMGCHLLSGWIFGRTLWLFLRTEDTHSARLQGDPTRLPRGRRPFAKARLQLRLEAEGQSLVGALIVHPDAPTRRSPRRWAPPALPPDPRRFERVQRVTTPGALRGLTEEVTSSVVEMPPA